MWSYSGGTESSYLSMGVAGDTLDPQQGAMGPLLSRRPSSSVGLSCPGQVTLLALSSTSQRGSRMPRPFPTPIPDSCSSHLSAARDPLPVPQWVPINLPLEVAPGSAGHLAAQWSAWDRT